ncbi:universal stress protein [Cyclobacterium amurskyense]|uniref:Universal stress protein family protein n=1 Tax=Cyclobacterium amurskyense TaxID=320787 RepID=A0A0H4PTM8_9BACT|nr:universal stress protein [Cyclobacterium amurskyense]AKP51687.1 Universal stress protein family protein [Cyclobacterium amurskyense]|tara:strand:+ start:9944 stop:10855 length:912 start_codon:yes stop_codon:yes gene_type:complete
MKQFKKVMVGLDLSHLDEILISNIKIFVPILDIEKVYFIHFSKSLILPNEVTSAYPDLLAPLDETIESQIQYEIEKTKPELDFDFEIIVKEGNPQESMLRWCNIKETDLLIMGRKKGKTPSDSLVKNLSQKYPRPVLLLPETPPTGQINNILLPIDFSKHSKVSILLALEISKKTNATLQCCHMYTVPSGYSKTGKTFEEFATIMLENAKKDFKAFLEENDLPDLLCTFILHDKKDEADNIMDFAHSIKTDLLIVGSRGRSRSAAVLLGSVAEKLVNSNHDIPMLVMKEKGENMGFLEALFRI